MKRCLTFILAILLVSALPLYATAAEVSTSKSVPAIRANEVRCENIEIWDSGYICITTSDEPQIAEVALEYGAITPYGPVLRETTRNFTHTISDRNGIIFADFCTTVTGYYYYPEQDAEITGVAGYFANTTLTGLGYSTSFNGSTATVTLRKDGLAIGSITYQITPSGTITWY